MNLQIKLRALYADIEWGIVENDAGCAAFCYH